MCNYINTSVYMCYNLYSYLDVNSKKASANVLVNALKVTDTKK